MEAVLQQEPLCPPCLPSPGQARRADTLLPAVTLMYQGTGPLPLRSQVNRPRHRRERAVSHISQQAGRTARKV